MTTGKLDQGGAPTVTGYVTFPALQREGVPISEGVVFLLDTGAEVTCIHDHDAERMEVPFDKLKNSDTGTLEWEADQNTT